MQGESGILVPPKTPAALAEVIRSLAGSHSLHASIVQHAHLRMETQFGILSVIPKVEAFYRKVFNALES